MQSRAHQPQTPFSVDHHCYTNVAGKIDRQIYMHLMREGLARSAWTVRANFNELKPFHKWGDDYTNGCLQRLGKRGLLVPVCKVKGGKIYLLPALTQWVSEPKARRSSSCDIR